MVASGFLPVTIYKNKILFLFGKEANNDDTPGWSDFVGGVDTGESIYEGGLREFTEETTGFFGNTNDVRKLVKKKGGFYKFVHDTYNIHIFKLDYDEKLIDYYNKSHKFIYDNVKDHTFLKSTKIFEKIEMKWFSPQEMKKRRSEFRLFYQEILDKILKDLPKIKKFISSKNKTFKNRSVKNKTVRYNRK